MMPTNVILGGLSLYSIRDTWTRVRGVPQTLARSNNLRTLGQQGSTAVTQLSGNVYPMLDTDAPLLQTLLARPGVLPLVLMTTDPAKLSNLERYPVRFSGNATANSGWYDQVNDSYPLTLDVEANCVLADQFWGAIDGSLAYQQGGGYTRVGSVSLLANSGARLVGNGTNFGTAIYETGPFATSRAQPTLVVDFTINTTGEGAIGIRLDATTNTALPLLSDGVGLHWKTNQLSLMEQGQSDAVTLVTSPVGTYTLIVVLRPIDARVELWSGRSLLLRSSALAWRTPDITKTPIAAASIKSGTMTLSRWYMLRV